MPEKSEFFGFWVTPNQKEIIEKGIEESGLSKSQYFRQCSIQPTTQKDISNKEVLNVMKNNFKKMFDLLRNIRVGRLKPALKTPRDVQLLKESKTREEIEAERTPSMTMLLMDLKDTMEKGLDKILKTVPESELKRPRDINPRYAECIEQCNIEEEKRE